MNNEISTPWVVVYPGQAHPRLRLFCFPYAGGSASLFRPWRESLDPAIEICAIQLPGRERRYAEPAITELSDLLSSLELALRPLLTGPYAFFGHSLGALVSFELVHRLRVIGAPLPVAFFPSGCRAPHLPDLDHRLHLLPDADFLQELAILNGTPREVLAHAELMQLMLPLLRADFTLAETYIYHDKSPLPCPIAAFGGMEDPEVSETALEGWAQHTSSSFKLRRYLGDHFFLYQAFPRMAQALGEDLARLR